MDNLTGNLRISSDAVIADVVDNQNSSLGSQFFPLVYIVTSLGRRSQLNYKLLNPIKSVTVLHLERFVNCQCFLFPYFFFSQS